MNRTHITGMLIATTVIVMAVVVYAAFNHREVSDSPHAVKAPDQTKIISHEVPSVIQVIQPEIPASLNIPASFGMTRMIDKAMLYSVEIPGDWHIGSNKGADELPANHYSHMTGTSPDFHYDAAAEVIDNPSVPIDRGMEFEIDVYEEAACINAVDQRRAVDNVHAEDVFPRNSTSPKTEWEISHPHEVKKLAVTFIHDGVCLAVKAIYNSKSHPKGEEIFVDMLKSVKFTKR